MKNKKVIGMIYIIAIIAIIIVTCILANKNGEKQSSETNTSGSEINVANDIQLNRISFNGMKIGDIIPEEAKKTLVMDAPFRRIYENIYIDEDKNDNIDYLGFSTTEDSQGNNITIKDVSIKYDNNELTSISDFKNILGNGAEVDRENNDRYYIEYYDNELKLILSISNNELYGVILKKK